MLCHLLLVCLTVQPVRASVSISETLYSRNTDIHARIHAVLYMYMLSELEEVKPGISYYTYTGLTCVCVILRLAWQQQVTYLTWRAVVFVHNDYPQNQGRPHIHIHMYS